jgi:hypothetical protein
MKTQKKIFTEQERKWMVDAIWSTIKEVELQNNLDKLRLMLAKYESPYTPSRDEIEDDMVWIDRFWF